MALVTMAAVSYTSLAAKGRLISVSDVQEAVWVLSLLVDFWHQSVSLQDVSSIHKEVEWVLLWQSDSLSDDESKLICGQVTGCQVPIEKRNGLISVSKVVDLFWWKNLAGARLFASIHLLAALVIGEARSRCLLANDRHLIWVLVKNLLGLFLTLLYRKLVS